MQEEKEILEDERNSLISKYSQDEISFFESLIKASDAAKLENSISFEYVVKEDGSNG